MLQQRSWKPSVVAIIQARLSSNRFPKKILQEINGLPVLEHVVRRVRLASLVNKVVIAAPHSPMCCLDEEIFIGSEWDVLDRYYQCAKKYEADIIVRITADCPLISPFEVDRVVSEVLCSDWDYATNRPAMPDGFDVEAFKFSVLERAWNEAVEPYDREHVTPWIKNNTPNLILLEAPKLSLDTSEDLEKIKEWYELERQANSYYGWNGEFCKKLHTTSTFKV